MNKADQPQRVVIAMSGGVDSSVAAGLLKEQGYDVIGVSMQVWDYSRFTAGDGNTFGTCCSLDDIHDARRVAEKLEIPFYVINFEEEFQAEVIDDFVAEYYRGRTPNPCVRCNQRVKFELLMKKARQLGADLLATGHYAVKRVGDDGLFHLVQGLDNRKDQSYFLFTLTQEQLAHILFPVGGMTKPEVRAHAARMGLRIAEKGESQEICFVPDNDYVRFLEEARGAGLLDGEIAHVDGTVVGRHHGTYRYTVGQRKGLGIAWKEPLYVVGVDAEAKRVLVGEKEHLEAAGLRANHINWIIPPEAEEISCRCRIRYRHQPVPCTIRVLPDERVEVRFNMLESSVTPGQAVVFYRDEEVLGGGWIEGKL